MVLNVTINGGYLTYNDIQELNCLSDNRNVYFTLLESHNFLPPEVILILIEIAKTAADGMLINALYDTLKFTLHGILVKISTKKLNKTVQLEVVYNNKKLSFKCNFPLTNEQTNQLINAVVQNFLND